MEGFPCLTLSGGRSYCRTVLLLGIALSLLFAGIGCGDFTLFGEEDGGSSGPCDGDPCADIDNAQAASCQAVGDSDYTCDCDANYFWKDDGNTCEDPCASDPCNDIENAVDDSCAGQGVEDFECDCDEGYVWDDGSETCEDDPCDPDPCAGKDNAIPDTCTADGGDDYTCDCEDDYFWRDDGDTCEDPCASDPCDGIPNAEAGSCTGIDADDFGCDCASGYVWDGATNTCEADPCESEPCDTIENAVGGTCQKEGAEDFTCECVSGYDWDGASNSCEVDPCDPDPCAELDNTVSGTCEVEGTGGFSCECDLGFKWAPQISQCELTALGALQSGPYEFTVVEVNDGIFSGAVESVLTPGTILDDTVIIPSLEDVPETQTISLGLGPGAFVDLEVEIDQADPSHDFYTLTGSSTGSYLGCTLVGDGNGEMAPESATSVSVSARLSNPVLSGASFCDFVTMNPLGTIEVIFTGELQ